MSRFLLYQAFLRIVRRKRTTFLSLCGYCICAFLVAASGSIFWSGYLGAVTAATANISATKQNMENARREYERFFRHLGHTVRIIAPEQKTGEFLATGAATHFFDESIVSRIATIDTTQLHTICPIIRTRIYLPVFNRTVFLLGVGREVNDARPKPLLEQPAPGTVFIGFELHRNLQISEGDTVIILKRPFVVNRCSDMAGSRDDITVTFSIADARNLLGEPRRYNEILAASPLDARSLGKVVGQAAGMPMVVLQREKRMATIARSHRTMLDASNIAIERERGALAAAKRQSLQRFYRIVGAALLLSVLWTVFIVINDLSRSRPEIAVYTAVGFHDAALRLLFITTTAIVVATGSLSGGLSGIAAGSIAGKATLLQVIPGVIAITIIQTAAAVTVTIFLMGFYLEKDPATLFGSQ